MTADNASLHRRSFTLAMAGCVAGAPALSRAAEAPVADVRLAYLWGYPVVDMYAILRGQALDPGSAEFKAPLNSVGHARQVATPEDRVVIAPNVDTPYSQAWLDLRAEPVVVSVPSFEPERYLSLQLFDLYTYIIDYVTPRTNGHAGGDFLIVAPDWKGSVPAGIRKVFRSTTTLALAMFRTQLLAADDLGKVHALQDRIQVRTLSAYLGRPGPKPQPLPALLPALNLREKPTDPAFFDVLGWMMGFMPALPDEVGLRRGFERIGLRAGHRFQPAPAEQAALLQGMGMALKEMGERARRVRSSAELFGSRDFLKDDYLTRAVGAMLGILGNAAEEYLGIGWQTDAERRPFDGSRRYRIRFAAGQLPPVDAFWSITVYTQERLLYANPLKRYVINSPLLATLKRDADGGITLHVQHGSPGADRESNWLPCPATPFGLTFRTYLPQEAIRSGRWTAPPVEPIS